MVYKRIRYFRKKIRMSQYELSKLVGLEQTLISRIERGLRKVTAEELLLFSNALGVSVSDLYEESKKTA
ncbi:XRE family transcriptional regulator [Brevibacillus laterosporus]|nr:helix-turn-helix transcriptional regulator [Brevibacillus laterosporus]TPG86842.1 XRE family transcriptional regulator [Brevibacillus laterosporus]